ncbi:signal peptidase II [Actinopolymorpha pittospori]
MSDSAAPAPAPRDHSATSGPAGGSSPSGHQRALLPRVVVFAVAAVILAVDQATKFWAVSSLTDRAPISLIGDFLELRLLYNPGAAFSIGTGATWIFTILAGVAVVALGVFATRARSLGWAVGLGLPLGGASTHLLDRLFRSPGFGMGHVVDFIDYNGWFVGNVADIALVVGAGVLILQSLVARDADGRLTGLANSNPGSLSDGGDDQHPSGRVS